MITLVDFLIYPTVKFMPEGQMYDTPNVTFNINYIYPKYSSYNLGHSLPLRQKAILYKGVSYTAYARCIPILVSLQMYL